MFAESHTRIPIVDLHGDRERRRVGGAAAPILAQCRHVGKVAVGAGLVPSVPCAWRARGSRDEAEEHVDEYAGGRGFG
jgi:hypothetical protein